MSLKAVIFHPDPESSKKNQNQCWFCVPPDELETMLSSMVNIRSRGRNRREEEKCSSVVKIIFLLIILPETEGLANLASVKQTVSFL